MWYILCDVYNGYPRFWAVYALPAAVHINYGATWQQTTRHIVGRVPSNVLWRSQVLLDHDEILIVPEIKDAFGVAKANVEILEERVYNTNKKMDKHALAEAKRQLHKMLVSPLK